MTTTEPDSPVSASESERQIVEYPSDLGDMLHRLREDVTVEIGEEYGDEDGTPLPVDLEVELEMTVHNRDPEVDGDD